MGDTHYNGVDGDDRDHQMTYKETIEYLLANTSFSKAKEFDFTEDAGEEYLVLRCL